MFSQLESKDRRVVLDLGSQEAVLTMEGSPILSLPIVREGTLTADRAAELAGTGPRPALVAFERSSPQARELLREAGIPYAAENGEVFLHAPPVHVEWPAARGATWPGAAAASPFAIRASRVARWLLLHVDAEPFFKEIGAEIELSESMVSRTIRALEEDRLVAVHADARDTRRRRVRLRSAAEMLDAFERADAARKPRRQTWDVGARDVDQVLDRLRRAAKYLELPYVVSGLAGASLVRRVVEPVAVDTWVARTDVDRWMEELAAVPARPGPAKLTVRLAPDPFVFSLGTSVRGISVADSVQLYLDCRRIGERALEAAEAIRKEMGW
jgi:DNA-binding MarR family transcriptional regulator